MSNSDDEIVNEISFTGIYDGTNYPIKIYTYDNILRNIIINN